MIHTGGTGRRLSGKRYLYRKFVQLIKNYSNNKKMYTGPSRQWSVKTSCRGAWWMVCLILWWWWWWRWWCLWCWLWWWWCSWSKSEDKRHCHDLIYFCNNHDHEPSYFCIKHDQLIMIWYSNPWSDYKYRDLLIIRYCEGVQWQLVKQVCVAE